MLLQFIINGLITGLLYSLLAIGFALVYNTTHIFHIAAAAIYVFAAYMFWWLATRFTLPLWAAAISAIGLSMFLSLGIEVLIYRPLRKKKASSNIAMISSIGVMTLIVSILAIAFGNEGKIIVDDKTYVFSLGSILITYPQICEFLASVFAICALLFFINARQYGLQIRALGVNEELFESLGYNVKRVRNRVFLLSGSFIGLASCLNAYDVGLTLQSGMNILIYAIVAFIIGGIGKYWTCIIGGLILGVLQSLTVFVFASNWMNVITFIVLILILFVRPQGLFGYKQRAV